MNFRPLVSVIIPSYNAARYVAEAVASALAQTYQPLEIILINDGSTDDTEEVILPYVGKVRYFYQPNRGLSVTRNRAIALARGELIAFLDADDVWLPEKLARQVDCLTQNPRVGLVHTNYVKLYADTGIRLPRNTPDITDGRCYTRLALGNICWFRRSCSGVNVWIESGNLMRKFPNGHVKITTCGCASPGISSSLTSRGTHAVPPARGQHE